MQAGIALDAWQIPKFSSLHHPAMRVPLEGLSGNCNPRGGYELGMPADLAAIVDKQNDLCPISVSRGPAGQLRGVNQLVAKIGRDVTAVRTQHPQPTFRPFRFRRPQIVVPSHIR